MENTATDSVFMPTILGIASTVLSILLIIIGFFLKKLVTEIDLTRATLINLDKTTALIQKDVTTFRKEIDTLSMAERKSSEEINRTRDEIVQARQIAMYFSKSLTKYSLASIGAQIGSKDNATVLHACKTVNNLKDTDKNFRQFVEDIEKKLKM